MLAAVAVVTGAVVARKMGLLMLFSVSFNKLLEGGLLSKNNIVLYFNREDVKCLKNNVNL